MNKKKQWKREIVSKIEIKLQFPYVVPAPYDHRTAADIHYNIIVHNSKSIFVLNV